MLKYLIIFWFVREIKAVLFWLYLWQLKEYHIGRFLDYFHTEQGKKLLINRLLFLKVFLLLFFLLSEIYYGIVYQNKVFEFFEVSFFFILFLLYLSEASKVFYDTARGKLTKPFFTKKIIFLSAVLFVSTGTFFLYIVTFYRSLTGYFFAGLLLFDVLAPLITSAIVLIFQPLAVFGRNRIIKAARKKRGQYKNLITIGITGSYGKTSTKEILAEILSKKFKVLKTKEHQNSEVGISFCILNDLKPEHEIFIAEMGAYNSGGIRLLCGIARPNIGILTGINEQHMATYGSQENIIKTKFELIESLPEDGIAILNWDSIKKFPIFNFQFPMKFQIPNSKVKNIKICSAEEKTDVWAENIVVEKEYVSFKAIYRDGDAAEFKVNLLGRQNVENILMAASVAKELGMTMSEISEMCSSFAQDHDSMTLLKSKQGFNIISSTYSANSNGVLSALDYLRVWPGKKVIIMPCLIELGKASKDVHARIGKKIGDICDMAIITKKECFEAIKRAAVIAGLKEENILFEDDPGSIAEKIRQFCRPDDVILLEGRLPKEIIKLLSE